MSPKLDVLIDYSQMSSLADNVEKRQQEYEKMLNKLDSLAQQINSEWTGNAQVEFATAYSKLKPKLNVVSNVLSNYSKAVTDVIQFHEDMDKIHANGIRRNIVTF